MYKMQLDPESFIQIKIPLFVAPVTCELLVSSTATPPLPIVIFADPLAFDVGPLIGLDTPIFLIPLN